MFNAYRHYPDTVAFLRSPLRVAPERHAFGLARFLFAMGVALALTVLL